MAMTEPTLIAPEQLRDVVLAAIVNGDLDGELDQIVERIRRRRDVIARTRTASIGVGDTVRFTNVIRPKYLAGLHATVTKINQQTITVSCPRDAEYGRYSGAKNVRCPLNLLEAI